MDQWATQLRKGLVQFCLLKILSRGQTYGYRLVQRLRGLNGLAFTESTVYPALGRLIGEQLVRATERASSRGPRRRYLRLTRKGKEQLALMETYWVDVCRDLESLEAAGLPEDGDD